MLRERNGEELKKERKKKKWGKNEEIGWKMAKQGTETCRRCHSGIKKRKMFNFYVGRKRYVLPIRRKIFIC